MSVASAIMVDGLQCQSVSERHHLKSLVHWSSLNLINPRSFSSHIILFTCVSSHSLFPIPMFLSSSSSPSLPMVVVTGGSGFLASHILKLLIKSGRYRIRATVRNAQDTKNAKIMDEIREAARLELEAERRAGQMPTVELVSADLEHSTDSDWDRAVSGARFVIYTMI